MRRRTSIRGHPVVVELIGQRQVEATDVARPPGRGQLVVDQFGVPRACGVHTVGLVARPSDIRLTTAEFGEERLEAAHASQLSACHSTKSTWLTM